MKKVVIGCLGAAVLFVVVVVVVGVVAWSFLFRELPVLDATISVPAQAALDSTVTLVVATTNAHKQAVMLDSIDIDDSFLTGFQVVSIDPQPTETAHMPLLNQRSWSFAKPGGSFSVTFTLRAVVEGHFSGDVDICNPNQDFNTLLADVVVRK